DAVDHDAARAKRVEVSMAQGAGTSVWEQKGKTCTWSARRRPDGGCGRRRVWTGTSWCFMFLAGGSCAQILVQVGGPWRRAPLDCLRTNVLYFTPLLCTWRTALCCVLVLYRVRRTVADSRSYGICIGGGWRVLWVREA